MSGPERDRRLVVVALFALLMVGLFARAAFAQHPCDASQPVSAVVGPGGRASVGFCHDKTDQNGEPISGPIAFRVEIDGVARDVGELQPQGGPNAEGLFYYATPPLDFGPLGGRVVRAMAMRYLGGAYVPGLASSPLPVLVMGLPPAPRGLRIAGG